MPRRSKKGMDGEGKGVLGDPTQAQEELGKRLVNLKGSLSFPRLG